MRQRLGAGPREISLSASSFRPIRRGHLSAIMPGFRRANPRPQASKLGMDRVGMKTWNTVAIIGVGLIGGSIGMALRRRKLVSKVVGIGRRASSLAKAKQVGAVDETTTDLARGVHEAELIIVATPVELVSEIVAQAAAACPACALITDAGSTKAEIVAHGTKLCSRRSLRDKGVAFVGSHPLAGSERAGPEAANADLFAGRTVVVTPVKQTLPHAVGEVRAFWELLGSQVHEMSPKAHDAAVGATSHVPHILASALAAATPEEALSLVAGGWLDTTRVAAGEAELWRQILASNRSNVIRSLNRVMAKIQAFRQALVQENDQELVQLLEAGKRIRDTVGN